MFRNIALMVLMTAFGVVACKSHHDRPSEPSVLSHVSRNAYAYDGFDNQVTVFVPKEATGPVPWLFSVPGGGWRRVAPPGGTLADELGQSGIAVVVASYRTQDKAKWPAQRDDVEAAFDYVRSHARELGLQPGNYVIAGSSAGATEAAWLSIAESPACTLLTASPLDFTTFRNRETRDVLAGYDPRGASPLFAVRSGMAPTVLIHGARDKVVPFNQSVSYAQALRKAGNRVELWEHGGGHLNVPSDLKQRARALIRTCLGVS